MDEDVHIAPVRRKIMALVVFQANTVIHVLAPLMIVLVELQVAHHAVKAKRVFQWTLHLLRRPVLRRR
jgi:hypothetical protein